MKKLISLLSMFIFFLDSKGETNPIPSKLSSNQVIFLKAAFLKNNKENIFYLKSINIWYTTADGYTIHAVGSLNISVFPIGFSFHGTVDITGNSTNLHLVINYGLSGTCSVSGEEIDDTEVVDSVSWSTDSYLADEILNQPDVESFFISEFNGDGYTDPPLKDKL